MRRSTRLAVVTAASAALVCGGAAAASADSVTVKDKRSDVVLNGSVGGGRTTAQKGLAHGTDAKGAKFTLGRKYIAVRVDLATVRQDVRYTLDVTVSRRGEAPDPVTGFPQLHVEIGPGGPTVAYTTGTNASSTTMCGGGPPAARRTGQKITAGLKLGRGGYLSVQVPRACLGADPSSKKIERKASFKVSSPGRGADLATSTDRYEDSVSTTKYKTAKWTPYVKG